MLLPPVAAYAWQYAYGQALQFLIFAVAGQALLVLGTPWRSRRAKSSTRFQVMRRAHGGCESELSSLAATLICEHFPFISLYRFRIGSRRRRTERPW